MAAPTAVEAVQLDRAHAELAASRARVAAVLAAEPWPNPADRNQSRLQDIARDEVKAAMDVKATVAAAALARAEQLRGCVGLVAKVLAMAGVQTSSVRVATEAAGQAVKAESDAKGARLDYRNHLGQADRRGAAQADRRQRERDQWERRADVRAARREEIGNRMVLAAAKSGDPEIQAALKQQDGLRSAREIILRRKAERRAQAPVHDSRRDLVRSARATPEMAAAFRR